MLKFEHIINAQKTLKTHSVQGPHVCVVHVDTLAAALAEAQALQDENTRLKAEVARWKNHHETEVRRARILKERTDMPIERVKAYEQWGKDQAELAEWRDLAVKAVDALEERAN